MPIECPQDWCARTQIKTVRGESALYLATHESPAQKCSISVNVAPADIAYIESFKGKVRLWEDDDQDYVLKGDGGARFAGLVLLVGAFARCYLVWGCWIKATGCFQRGQLQRTESQPSEEKAPGYGDDN